MKKIALLFGLLLATPLSCQAPDDTKNEDHDSAEQGEDDQDTEDNQPDTAGTISVDMTVTESLNFTETTLETAVTGDTATTLAGTLQVAALTANESQSSFNPNCTETTAAFDTDTNAKMEASNPLWPGREIYCKLNGPAGSPESVRGAFLIAKGIICSGSKIKDLKFEETEDVFTGDVTINKECFGAMATQATDLSEGQVISGIEFKTQLLKDEPHGWQKQISYKVPNETEYEVIKYFLSEDLVAFTSRDWGVTVNGKEDRLSYEMMDDEHERHVRIMVVGELNLSTGALSNISKVEAIYSGESKLGTIAGTTEGGYASIAYSTMQSDYASMAFSDFTESSTRCSKDTCLDTSLKFDKETYFESFVYFSPSMDANGLLGKKPVDFATVGWDAL